MNILKELDLEEISAVTDPAQEKALFKITKSKEEDKATVESTIKKFIKLESTLRSAEQSGEIQKMNVSKSTAESGLDELAVALQAQDPSMTAEQAFFKSLQLCPTLGMVAVGQTTGN